MGSAPHSDPDDLESGHPVIVPVLGCCRHAVGDRGGSDPRVVDREVGWPGGFAPPGSHRSGRNSLPLSGSSHPPISQHERTHFHWANRSGCLSISPTHHRLNRLKDRNRRYFFPAQRLR